MSTQAWTVIGIIIGALLAGSMQLGVAVFNARTARRNRLYNERREAYLNLLIAWEAVRKVERDVPHDDPTYAEQEAEAYDRFHGLYRLLDFVAPQETMDSAGWLADQTSDYLVYARTEGKASQKRKDSLSAASIARLDFIKHAMRDLGLT